jgi:uncharacterized protein with GYD domain
MHFIFNRRMASASVLQRLNQRAKEAEHMITELKGQIENLRQTAGHHDIAEILLKLVTI